MMAPDLWHRVWQLVLTYPGMAIMLVVILCLLGTLLALALLSLSRPPLPLHQWEDDEAQARAVSGRVPLESWRRSGGNWKGDL